MPWWGWIAIGCTLLGAEVMITTDFYLAVLGAAALSVGLAATLGLQTDWLQWGLFGALSVAYLVGFRRRLADRLGVNGGEELPLLDGEIAIVSDDIPPGEIGRAELRGTMWTAKNLSREALTEGTRARVERTDGLTIHLRSEAEHRARARRRLREQQ